MLGVVTGRRDRYVELRKIAIDLRQNGGGDFNVGRKYLVDELARRPKLRGFVIYPGKLTRRPSFRIGNIGQVDAEVMQALVEAVRETLRELGVRDMTPDAEEDERRAS